MRQYLKLSVCLVLCLGCFTSCKVNIKPYERVYVNDAEMQMSESTCKAFAHYVHSIREGGITPATKKGNGGCGCN